MGRTGKGAKKGQTEEVPQKKSAGIQELGALKTGGKVKTAKETPRNRQGGKIPCVESGLRNRGHGGQTERGNCWGGGRLKT